MKLLIDMNLSPRWVVFLQTAGHQAEHWASIGDPRADDAQLMLHARDNSFVVLTHDLDFGDMLAATGGNLPSVVQIRGDDVSPEVIGDRLLRALHQCVDALDEGALVSIDLRGSRLRLLPLQRKT